MTEATYIMTWDEDQDYFVQGIGEILADPSYDKEGLDELLANYMKDGSELDWEVMTKSAETCYYNIFDEVNRRLDPTVEMLEIGSEANEEYVEAFDDQLHMNLDVLATMGL